MASGKQTPYVNLTALKAQLKISSTDTTDDVWLTQTSQYVQGFIDRYTGRTFGWGDPGDNSNIDYSNSDNIGVLTLSLSGTLNTPGALLTVTTMGPVPWVVGQSVSLFNTNPNKIYDGVWKVSSVTSPTTIVLDVSAQSGTLGPSDNSINTNLPAPNFSGYIGNYVQNYKYASQEQYDGFAGKIFYLRNMDIRSIDTLYVGLRNVAQPVLLDHTQYVWRDDGRVILGGSYFNTVVSGMYDPSQDSSFYGTVASGFQTITVSYWVGYIGVPFEITLAALDLATALYAYRKSLGLKREQMGDYSIEYDITLRKQLAVQPDTLNMLNIMRRLHVS